MSPEHHQPHHGAPEREHHDGPRIYVASLADYNAGVLHGRFISADQEPDDIYGEIAQMLAESTEPSAEEWAIHDYDGFGPLQLSEYERIETVARIARGITEHGLAFAHWVAYIGTDDEEGIGAFEDHYLGHWSTITEYAEELLNDLGAEQALDRLDDYLRSYVRIDTDAMARDIEIEYHASEGEGGVHLFLPR